MKAQITMRALLQRINRSIKPGQIRKVRSDTQKEIGPYYIVNGKKIRGNVDPEGIGREIGVLRDWEELV